MGVQIELADETLPVPKPSVVSLAKTAQHPTQGRDMWEGVSWGGVGTHDYMGLMERDQVSPCHSPPWQSAFSMALSPSSFVLGHTAMVK